MGVKKNEVSPAYKKLLEKQHYAFSGKNSAVKLCTWTKRGITKIGVCYKQQFYGIESHRCCQMTPTIGFCQNNCMHCWRELDSTIGTDMDPDDLDDPKSIVENSLFMQRKLLSGFGGNEKADKAKLKEARDPKHFAISLSGEPLIYPKIEELIKEVHRRKMSTFLVTNGMLPEVLSKMKVLPTQLYVSMNASNEKDFKKLVRSHFSDGWERYLETLDILSTLKTRTTIRITLMKCINMSEDTAKEFAELIKHANPWFIEVKSYMFVGSSRERLEMKNMPLHEEVIEFSNKIAHYCGYKLIDDKRESRVALLLRPDLNKSDAKIDFSKI